MARSEQGDADGGRGRFQGQGSWVGGRESPKRAEIFTTEARRHGAEGGERPGGVMRREGWSLFLAEWDADVGAEGGFEARADLAPAVDVAASGEGGEGGAGGEETEEG